MLSEIRVAGYLPEAIATIGTIELKKDEPLLKRLSELLPNAKVLIHKEEELAKIIYEYGEEKFSRQIARKIVLERQKKEIEANEFAGEFLMPESQCKEDLYNLKYKDLGMKKYYWKVSKAAIIYRAKELKCISEQTSRYLYVTLGRYGERKTESVQVPIDNPKIVNRMFDLHISELKYSMKELSDIVGLIPDEINTELLSGNTSVSIKPRKIMLNF